MSRAFRLKRRDPARYRCMGCLDIIDGPGPFNDHLEGCEAHPLARRLREERRLADELYDALSHVYGSWQVIKGKGYPRVDKAAARYERSRRADHEARVRRTGRRGHGRGLEPTQPVRS